MVRTTSTTSINHCRWVVAGEAGLALGALVSVVGSAIVIYGPPFPCGRPAPTLLVVGVGITLAGGFLQIVPLIVALTARRRWRTALVLAGALVLYGLYGVIAVPSPWWLLLLLPSATGVLLALRLRGSAARPSTPLGLSALQANVFFVCAFVFFVGAFLLAYGSVALVVGVSLRHFCLG